MEALYAGLSVFLVTAAGALWAQRTALADDGSQARERKTQDRPVPRVGGIALLAGLVWIEAPASWPALLAAFAVGLVDDLMPGGLRPAPKALAQALAAAVVAWCLPWSGGEAWLAWAACWLAFNLANTYDNSDGALASLVVGGAACQAQWIWAALAAGFWPWNTLLRQSPRAPRAYWGDSGSHLWGALCVMHPELALLLVLPAMDLAWLAWVRWREGSRPWVGDRRHLAQRMEACGWPLGVRLLALFLIQLPCIVGWGWWGVAGTLLLYISARILTNGPCRRERRNQECI